MSRVPTEAEIERCGRAGGNAVCSGWSNEPEVRARIRRFIADGCRKVPGGCVPEYYVAVAAEWAAILAETPTAPPACCPKCGNTEAGFYYLRVQRDVYYCADHPHFYCFKCGDHGSIPRADWDRLDDSAWRSNGEKCKTCQRSVTHADSAPVAPARTVPSPPANPAPTVTPAPIATACEGARRFLAGPWRTYINDAVACRRLDELRHQLRKPDLDVARRALAFIVGPECAIRGSKEAIEAHDRARREVVRGLMEATKGARGSAA